MRPWVDNFMDYYAGCFCMCCFVEAIVIMRPGGGERDKIRVVWIL